MFMWYFVILLHICQAKYQREYNEQENSIPEDKNIDIFSGVLTRARTKKVLEKFMEVKGFTGFGVVTARERIEKSKFTDAYENMQFLSFSSLATFNHSFLNITRFLAFLINHNIVFGYRPLCSRMHEGEMIFCEKDTNLFAIATGYGINISPINPRSYASTYRVPFVTFSIQFLFSQENKNYERTDQWVVRNIVISIKFAITDSFQISIDHIFRKLLLPYEDMKELGDPTWKESSISYVGISLHTNNETVRGYNFLSILSHALCYFQFRHRCVKTLQDTDLIKDENGNSLRPMNMQRVSFIVPKGLNGNQFVTAGYKWQSNIDGSPTFEKRDTGIPWNMYSLLPNLWNMIWYGNDYFPPTKSSLLPISVNMSIEDF